MKNLESILENIFNSDPNSLIDAVDDVYISGNLGIYNFDKVWPVICKVFKLIPTNNINQTSKSIVIVANLQHLSSRIKTENHFPQTSVYGIFLIKSKTPKSCDIYSLFLNIHDIKPVLGIENSYYLNPTVPPIITTANMLINKLNQNSISIQIYKLTQDNAIKLANYLKSKI